MKISRNVIIAALIISLILVLFFLIYQTLLTQSVVILTDAATILITPRLENWNSTKSSNELLKASQTPNPPGIFSVGMYVHISNTGGDGLRIRSFAGFDGVPVYLGQEGEQFEIIGGPMIKDSEIWWKIASISETQKIGWAVQDFLLQQ